MQAIFDYIKDLSIQRNLSPATIQSYERDLRQFWKFSTEQFEILEKPNSLESLDKYLVRDYLAYLTIEGYSRASIARILSAIRGFSTYLCRHQIIPTDFALNIHAPRQDKKLPAVMTVDEIECLVEGKSPSDSPLDARNHAMFELLYATGIRVSELVGLDLVDVDLENQYIRVMGKGRKERIVPFGDYALQSLQLYLSEHRPELTNPSETALFVNSRGNRLTTRGVQFILDKYTKSIDLQKPVSPHTFRHTFATHLLDNGADLRSVQELLGHTSLSTTQIYTRVSRKHLKSVYNKTHPRA